MSVIVLRPQAWILTTGSVLSERAMVASSEQPSEGDVMRWMVMVAGLATAGIAMAGEESAPGVGCSVVAGPALMGPWVLAMVVAGLMRIRRPRSEAALKE